jgi:HEAT repeat protein
MAWHHTSCWQEGAGKCSACAGLREQPRQTTKSPAPSLKQWLKQRVSDPVAVALILVTVTFTLFASVHISRSMVEASFDPALTIERLSELPAEKDSSTDLLRAMGHLSPDVRRYAVERWPEIPTQSTLYKVRVLGDMLVRDRDGSVRRAATDGLYSLGPDAAPALQQILHALDNDELRRVRSGAARTLKGIGAPARMQLTRIVARLASEQDWVVAAELATAVAALAPDDERTVKALTGAMKHPHVYVRKRALLELRGLGEQARAALPELLDHMDERTYDPAHYFAAAAVAGLTHAGTNQRIRAEAIVTEAAQRLSRELDEAPRGPTLTEEINGKPCDSKHRDGNLRSLAASYLFQLGDAGKKSSLPALRRAAKHKSRQVRQAATHALKQLGEGPTQSQATER